MDEVGDLSRWVIETDAELLSPSIRLPFFPLVVKTGQGAELEDQEGRRYIDFLSMAAIMNTGHGHPKVVAAIQEQAAKLIHCNPGYLYHAPLARLNRQITRITPGDGPKKVAYGLSGGDANDGTIKLARAATGRQKIIAFLKSYYGGTYGALSMSAISLPMRRKFGPFVPEVYHVPYPDCYRCPWGQQRATCRLECLKHFKEVLGNLVPAEEVAAVVMEPIQGDAGIIEPPVEYVQGVAEICKENGILLASEEVQTGMGRTGRWFAIEHSGIEPDIVVMGKALGSGVPISAIVARAELMDSWMSPAHIFCTAAGPLSCAAASATIEILEEEGLVERAASLGGYLRGRLEALADRFPAIGQIRGRGLMLGVDLVKDRQTRERALDVTAKVAWRCYEEGLLLTFFSGSVLRICPPLVISREQIDQACDILERAMADTFAGRVPDSVLDRIKGW